MQDFQLLLINHFPYFFFLILKLFKWFLEHFHILENIQKVVLVGRSKYHVTNIDVVFLKLRIFYCEISIARSAEIEPQSQSFPLILFAQALDCFDVERDL